MHSTIDLQAYQQITSRFSYNVFELLGGGTYGRVYKGYDNEAKKVIAVKHISLKILRQISNFFEREIDILKRLKHPNIIEYYGSHGGLNDSDGIFLFFQLCEKGTLSDSIIKKKPTEAQSWSIFKQLVEGMAYINSQQIFHRDLKPDNLLLNANNQLKIADFGTAIKVQLDEGHNRTYRRCTPVYAAPEVYLFQVYEQNGRNYTEKCDIFSAGYILYELLTGEQLTQGICTEAQLSAFLRNIKTSGMIIEHPGLTERWKVLLKRMMSFSPNQRPTFAEIRKILNSFEGVSNSPPVDRVCDEAQRQYSENMVELVKKTLQSQQRKNNYYINILKIFEAKKSVVSWVFPRPAKIILIYYSLMFYVKQAEDGLNILNNPIQLSIGQQNLETLFVRLVSNDKAELLKFIEEKANKLNKAVQQVKSFLNRQIIPEIELIQSFQEGHPQKMFLKQFRMASDIIRYRNGDFSLTNSYIRPMRQCLSYLYQTNADLQVLSQDDLKMYLVVANVADLQNIVGNLHRQNLKWPLSLRQIQELNKRALIRQIHERRVGQISV